MEAEHKRRRRLLGWATNKFNGSAVGQVNSILVENVRATRDRARLAEISREDVEAGINGRYADGGRERFRQMELAEGWTAGELQNRERSWKMQSRLYLLGAIVALLLPVAWVLFQPGWFALMMLVPGLVVPLALGAVAVKADFAAWQIRERRFGGLRDYFRGRAGG